MTRFIILRIIQAFVTLIVISMVIFALARASGDPVMLMAPPMATLEDIEVIRKHLGLDKSLPEQYWVFLKNMTRGDLGKSIQNRRDVTTIMWERLPNTVSLSLPAIFLGISVSLILGVTAACRRATWVDSGVKFLAILGQALPSFWLAIVAISVFAVLLGWLPTSGMGSPAHYVLPVLTLSFFMLPIFTRLLRSSMLEVLDTEYVKLARIKGLSERVVVWKHALRNAIIPLLTAAGITFATIVTGAVIIETVFAWPGLGRLMAEAMIRRDFPVVQAAVLLVAVVVLVVNLLVDIVYAYVDPRIRY
ncbi:MAG: ABC transporter permease [Dehalococcoidales bacterium]|nr:ABC transporter permease [Dehalococcoidales bacterium]